MSELAECSKLLVRYSKARIPFISINTTEQTRALRMTKQVAQDLNLSFYVFTMSRGIYDISSDKTVSEDNNIFAALDFISDQFKKHIQNLTFILTEVPDISGENELTKKLLDLINLGIEVGGTIIVLTHNSIWGQLQRLGMNLQLDLPNEQELIQIINNQLDPYRNEISIDWDAEDVNQAALYLSGASQIETENVIASLIANGKITKADLRQVQKAKDQLFSNISGLEKIKVAPDANQVGGLAGLKKWLAAKKKLLTPQKQAILRSRGLRPPRGILLVGVPGCGKSLSAKAIAADWSLPLYRLDFATVQSKWVGQSEQQLKDALLTADQMSPCILWIDEIEKGLAGTANAGNEVSSHLVGQFLFWLQESQKQVFVVATANDVSKLPPELLRRGRFDELFFVDLPNAQERYQILHLYIAKYLHQEFAGDFADKLVDLTAGFSGADLESAVRDLTYNSLANDTELSADDFLNEFQNIIPLSKTNPERIEAIRAWGRSRAVPASGHQIGNTDDHHSNTRKVLL